MKKLIILLLLVTGSLYSFTPPDSCIKLIWPHDPDNLQVNPDSVMIDSCRWSPTYGKWYAKKTFNFTIWKDIFSDTPNNSDSTFSVNEIDSSYSFIKFLFRTAQDSFGLLHFKRSDVANYHFYVFFSKYVCVDYVEKYFRDSLERIDGALFYIEQLPVLLDIEGITFINSGTVSPNPANNYISIRNLQTMKFQKVVIYNYQGNIELIINNIAYDNSLIDVSSLPSGFFILKIESGTDIKTSKFIIQR